MNTLKKLISIVKTGNPVEVKNAQKEIEHYYKLLEHPLNEENRKEFEIFADEIKDFDRIKDIDNQMYFIHTLKWPFMLIGDKHFEFFAGFVVKAIQHNSGKVRQAIIKTVDWLLISNVISLKDLGKNITNEEIESRKKTKEIFCRLAYEIESLIEKYHEPRFNRYKYISSLPIGIYKSLEILLCENLLRSPHYIKVYKKWLERKQNGSLNFLNNEVGGQEKEFNTVLQFKISLNDCEPKVWRRIVVPSNYSFFHFHFAIQNAMGWSDSHLHGFYIAQKGTSELIMIKFPDPENDGFFDSDYLDDREEKIADYFGKLVKQCQYTYDFGDSWDHTILFEKKYKADTKTKYPICVAGSGACPVENCGGAGGYERLLEILKNPRHKEYKEKCEWLGIEEGGEINPAEFYLSDVYFENPRQRQKEWEDGFGI